MKWDSPWELITWPPQPPPPTSCVFNHTFINQYLSSFKYVLYFQIYIYFFPWCVRKPCTHIVYFRVIGARLWFSGPIGVGRNLCTRVRDALTHVSVRKCRVHKNLTNSAHISSFQHGRWYGEDGGVPPGARGRGDPRGPPRRGGRRGQGGHHHAPPHLTHLPGRCQLRDRRAFQ